MMAEAENGRPVGETVPPEKLHLLVGDKALLVDLCKLRMGSADKVVEDIEKDLNSVCKYKGYVFGFHDFMIARQISDMGDIYDRSNIDRIEPCLNTHHRFFVYSFCAKKQGGGTENLLFDQNLFDNPSMFAMVLLNLNYYAISKIIKDEKDYGFIELLTDLIGGIKNDLDNFEGIDAFGIGGTLGLHSIAVFLRSNSISRIIKALLKIKGHDLRSIIKNPPESMKNKPDYEKMIGEPALISTYTVPSVYYGLDKDRLSDDRISVSLRMHATPGAGREMAKELTALLGGEEVCRCLPGTGRYDYIAKYDDISFREYYEILVKQFIETENNNKNIVWATESSISSMDEYDAELDGALPLEPLIKDFNTRNRKPRPSLSEKTYLPNMLRSLNKASSISYLSRHDMDSFAYFDLIPFYKRGWLHSITLALYKVMRDRIISECKHILDERSSEATDVNEQLEFVQKIMKKANEEREHLKKPDPETGKTRTAEDIEEFVTRKIIDWTTEEYEKIQQQLSGVEYIPVEDFEEIIIKRSIKELLGEIKNLSDNFDVDTLKNTLLDHVRNILTHCVEEHKEKQIKDNKNIEDVIFRAYHINKALAFLEIECSNESNLYIETINTLQVARLQRHWGTRTSFHTYIFNPANFECGIHLLLHGLCGYVYETFKFLNTRERAKYSIKYLTWGGFFNVDPNPLNIQLLANLQVISLPLQELLDIRNIIMDISHETAHAVFIASGVDKYISSIFNNLFRRNVNIVVELLCDVFAYATGFRGDLERYLSWVPEIFKSKGSYITLDTIGRFEMVLRIFSVYLFDRFYNMHLKSVPETPEQMKIPLAYDITAEFYKFIKYIRELSNGNERFKYISEALENFIVETGDDGDAFEDIMECAKGLVDALYILNYNKLSEDGNGNQLTPPQAPLIDVLGHHLMGVKFKLFENDEVRRLIREFDLSAWSRIFSGTSLEAKYDKIKPQLAHEFIFALTEYVRNLGDQPLSLAARCFAVLVNFDITQKAQLFSENKDYLSIGQDWV